MHRNSKELQICEFSANRCQKTGSLKVSDGNKPASLRRPWAPQNRPPDTARSSCPRNAWWRQIACTPRRRWCTPHLNVIQCNFSWVTVPKFWQIWGRKVLFRVLKDSTDFQRLGVPGPPQLLQHASSTCCIACNLSEKHYPKKHTVHIALEAHAVCAVCDAHLATT